MELGLPHYTHFRVSVESFLKDPNKLLSPLKMPPLFVFLNNKKGAIERRPNLSHEQAIAFVQEATNSAPDQWEVFVSENLEQVYGGNISVNREGTARIELRRGEQGPISAGTTEAGELLRAWQGPLTHLWKYDFDDPNQRALVQSVMHEVPHEKREYLPGLYEFQLVDTQADGVLEPRFVDYRSDLE